MCFPLRPVPRQLRDHYSDVIMGTMASQITSLTTVYSTVYSGAYQRKHQRSASLAFVRGIHRLPVNSPHKGPVTQKMLPFDDVIMLKQQFWMHVWGPVPLHLRTAAPSSGISYLTITAYINIEREGEVESVLMYETWHII